MTSSLPAWPLEVTSPSTPLPAPRERTYRFAFHGSGTAFFALMLKNMLLTLVTLGIYLPWAKTERRHYLLQNTEIDGHRLRYHGTGKELFWGYVKVVAAYIGFVAISALAGKVLGRERGAIVQVGLALIIFPLIPFAIWGARRYLLSRISWRGVHFRLEGSAKPYAKTFIFGYLLTLVTLGLYGPVWVNKLHRHLTNASALGSKNFSYVGEDKVMFKIALKGFFLTLLTLGFYMFWLQAKLTRYQLENTWFDRAHGEFDVTGFELLKLTLLQVVALTCTLGLAFPWVTAYSLRFMLERIRFRGHIDLARVYQMNPQGNAAAEGLADALDVGIAF